jgi:hypothetical protein
MHLSHEGSAVNADLKPIAAPAATHQPVASWPARLRRALQRWWQDLWLDEMAAYLSEATSHVDLEYRIRIWNEAAERRGRLPFV